MSAALATVLIAEDGEAPLWVPIAVVCLGVVCLVVAARYCAAVAKASMPIEADDEDDP